MTQSLQKLFTFEEFLEFLEEQPENIRYELYDGDIIQMPPPAGDHEKIVAFLVGILVLEYTRSKRPYGITKTAMVKPENKASGYYPDVTLLNFPNLVNEPRWAKESTVNLAASIPLVIEVVSQCVARVPRVEATDEPVRVSTNWRDDYFDSEERLMLQNYCEQTGRGQSDVLREFIRSLEKKASRSPRMTHLAFIPCLKYGVRGYATAPQGFSASSL